MSEKPLTKESFELHVGSTFRVSVDGEVVELRLDQVTEYAQFITREVAADGTDLGGRVPFSLAFSGSKELLLPDRIYTLSHPEMGELDLYLKPYHEGPESFFYEAVFN